MSIGSARIHAGLVVLSFALGVAACGTQKTDQATPQASGPEVVEPGQIAESRKTVIAILGDSITAGLGLTAAQAYPSRLQDMFAGEGYSEVEILNGGVSGDTTAGGLRRAESLLEPNVRILVIALGGNDALRGLSATQTRDNLTAIIDGTLQHGTRVMLVGMEAPTNLGEDYRAAFRGTFAELAREYRGRIGYIPFLLEGVAGNPSLNQADGIHPNEQGAKAVADHLYSSLRDMVDQLPPPGA